MLGARPPAAQVLAAAYAGVATLGPRGAAVGQMEEDTRETPKASPLYVAAPGTTCCQDDTPDTCADDDSDAKICIDAHSDPDNVHYYCATRVEINQPYGPSQRFVTRPHGISASRPRRHRDFSPRKIRVADAALRLSLWTASHRRRGHDADRPEKIAAISVDWVGSTSRPRRRSSAGRVANVSAHRSSAGRVANVSTHEPHNSRGGDTGL